MNKKRVERIWRREWLKAGTDPNPTNGRMGRKAAEDAPSANGIEAVDPTSQPPLTRYIALQLDGVAALCANFAPPISYRKQLGNNSASHSVEINVRKREVHDSPNEIPFSVENPWFTGKAAILTFSCEEILAVKPSVSLQLPLKTPGAASARTHA